MDNRVLVQLVFTIYSDVVRLLLVVRSTDR